MLHRHSSEQNHIHKNTTKALHGFHRLAVLFCALQTKRAVGAERRTDRLNEEEKNEKEFTEQ